MTKKEPARAGGDKKFNKERDEVFIEEKVKSPEGLEEIQNKKESTFGQETISQEKMKEELLKMDADDSLKMQAQSDANQVQSLKEEEEKVKTLLQMARHKGVIYAVNVAKKMGDPYVLDKLHDVLTEKGYYKKFLK